jgi:hypothetical protein
MARASIRTMLSLDDYARIMGISPLHFNQIELPTLHPATTCDQPLLQYSWQLADRTGREEIAEAISMAEDRLCSLLGFKLMPTWEIDERVRALGPGLLVRPGWGYFLAGGVQGKTLIEADASVVYSDGNSDGYYETATVQATLPSDVTDTEEVAVYYPGVGGYEAWEIRPRHVDITAGVATITVRRDQLLLVEETEAFGARGVDGTDDTKFLETVDVYRKYHDASQQAHLLWDGPVCGACEGAGCDACNLHLQTACLRAHDHRNSLVAVASSTYDVDTGLYVAATMHSARLPMRVRLWYRAGWRNMTLAEPHVTMDPKWARAVAYLATSLLDRVLCSCEALRAMSQHWREDLALSVSTQASGSSYRLGRVIDNPIGTTRGALAAWGLVKDEIVGAGVLV